MPDTAVMDRALAAAARAEALSQLPEYDGRPREASAQLPQVGGAARIMPCGAREMRAKLIERDGQQVNHLTGIASVVDTPYEMYDMFGPYEEVVERGAFTETLARDDLDVAFLLNHRGVTMARTTNDSLQLGMTSEGLGVDAWLNPKRQDVKDLVIAIDDGHIDQMSFAFMLEEGWWSDDFMTFKISKLDMHRGDVSAVNYGANPYTSIAARSQELLAGLDRLPAGAARAAMARLSSRPDLTPPPAPVEASGARVALYEALLELG